MNKKIIIPISVILLIFPLLYLNNYFTLQNVMNTVLKKDVRNDGVNVSVHYKYYIPNSTLIFDLQNVSGTNSKLDVFRVLLQFAEEVKAKEFESIVLCHKGEEKFIIDGNYFQTIGKEYSYQNPVYTMRTFPEHLKTPNGERAFGEWSGGWLGVMSKQMEDFNEFHNQWYLE